MNQPQQPQQEAAAFNAAVATLMRLDKILQDITAIMVKEQVDKGQKQHYKLRLVRAFCVQSIPLLKSEEDRKLVKDTVWELKPVYAKHTIHDTVPLFDDKLENDLDQSLITAQITLQRLGYFMPEKLDEGL